MTVELEISAVTIVLVGEFNPKIFHPSWFELQGVMSASEAASVDVKVVHPDLTQIEFGNLLITAERQRFSIATSSAPLVATIDLVAQVFGRLLTHTPIHQAGINTQRHYRLSSMEQRHEFGRKIAPLSVWGKWGERMNDKELDKESQNGVQVLAMREFYRDAPWAGWRQVKVEPSTVVAHNLGVFIDKNHHIYQEPPVKERLAAPDLVQYMSKCFDDVIADSTWIENELFKATDVF